MNKKFGLGKGLDALIQDYSASASINEIALDLIKESPYQPRFLITEDSLSELISSIRENGIIEPLVVRKVDEHYELIAGHRRLNALKFLHKETAPVYIIDVQDQKAAELTIVENIQRVDLNPVELAKSISQMLQRFSLTHEQVSKVLGKSRVYITNILRLLSLDADTIKALETQQISEGHGRLLLQVSDVSLRSKLLTTIIDKQWSVKQLGDYIKKASELKEKREVSVFLSKENKKTYEHTMSSFFNTPVKIKGKKIEILFKDEKEFLSFFNTFNSLITNAK